MDEPNLSEFDSHWLVTELRTRCLEYAPTEKLIEELIRRGAFDGGILLKPGEKQTIANLDGYSFLFSAAISPTFGKIARV